MLSSKFFWKPALWWNVKMYYIEYYDIQYAAGRTIYYLDHIKIEWQYFKTFRKWKEKELNLGKDCSSRIVSASRQIWINFTFTLPIKHKQKYVHCLKTFNRGRLDCKPQKTHIITFHFLRKYASKDTGCCNTQWTKLWRSYVNTTSRTI